MKQVYIVAVIFCCITSAAKADVLRIPLSKLTPQKSVDLRCVKNEYLIPIPIPERWEIKNSAASISYANSANLLGDKSQLSVRLNDRIIRQVKLNPITRNGKAYFNLPITQMKPGYNNLTFNVVQHYSNDCEQYCASDLWTTIYMDESYLDIEYTLKDVPLTLSNISDFLFDPKIYPHGNVNIITENYTSEMLTIAGIAASVAALKFDYKKVFFTSSNDIKKDYDNILIGTKGFVENFLRQKKVDIKIPGPFLKIIHTPYKNGRTDPLHGTLIISGNNQNDINVAAETLAGMTIPYPDTDEMIIKGLNPPEIPRYSGRQVLNAGEIYNFKNLDLPTRTFNGFTPMDMGLTFRLPADLLIKENKYAKIVLNFTYGAGLRNDSVLNIILNDKNVGVIHLKNKSGDYIEGYRIELPTYLFKQGLNTIKFLPFLNPDAKECDLLREDGYYLTIFENSTFYFPSMPHLAKMPRIELFMADGFPFTRHTDGQETLLYITQPDNNAIDAALNLIGLITQKNGYPLFNIKLVIEKPQNKDGEIIVLGSVNTIPQDFMDIAPLKIAKESSVPYPVFKGWGAESTFALSKQISGIGMNRGVVMEFESPYKKARSVLLLTGASTKELLLLSEALLETGVQAQMTGDLAIIDLKNPPVYNVKALSTGKKYFTARSDKFYLIDYYLYKYPYLYYSSITLLVPIISLVLFFYIKKYRKRRL